MLRHRCADAEAGAQLLPAAGVLPAQRESWRGARDLPGSAHGRAWAGVPESMPPAPSTRVWCGDAVLCPLLHISWPCWQQQELAALLAWGPPRVLPVAGTQRPLPSVYTVTFPALPRPPRPHPQRRGVYGHALQLVYEGAERRQQGPRPPCRAAAPGRASRGASALPEQTNRRRKRRESPRRPRGAGTRWLRNKPRHGCAAGTGQGGCQCTWHEPGCSQPGRGAAASPPFPGSARLAAALCHAARKGTPVPGTHRWS